VLIILFFGDLLNALQIDASFIGSPDNFIQNIPYNFVAVCRDAYFEARLYERANHTCADMSLTSARRALDGEYAAAQSGRNA
jgi:hypothetical protein